MKVRRFLWVLRRNPIALGFNVLSVVVTFGAALVTLEVAPAFSFSIAVLAVFLLAYGLVRFVAPGGDEWVIWKWEKRLLREVSRRDRAPVFCTRQVLTRAQGRALGCAAAQAAAGSIDYICDLLTLTAGEIRIESDCHLLDVEEHARHVDCLAKAAAAVSKMRCVRDLAVLADGDDGRPSALAAAVRDDLIRLPGIIEGHALRPLDNCARRFRRPDGASADEGQRASDQIKGALGKAVAVLRVLESEWLGRLRRAADELCTLTHERWFGDCSAARANPACEPICKELPA